jgi:hypothetical protein
MLVGRYDDCRRGKLPAWSQPMRDDDGVISLSKPSGEPSPDHLRRLRRAQRQKRYEDRLKAGRIVCKIEVDETLLDWLISINWLSEVEAISSDAIARAIETMLGESAAAHRGR